MFEICRTGPKCCNDRVRRGPQWVHSPPCPPCPPPLLVEPCPPRRSGPSRARSRHRRPPRAARASRARPPPPPSAPCECAPCLTPRCATAVCAVLNTLEVHYFGSPRRDISPSGSKVYQAPSRAGANTSGAAQPHPLQHRARGVPWEPEPFDRYGPLRTHALSVAGRCVQAEVRASLEKLRALAHRVRRLCASTWGPQGPSVKGISIP
jgi:hypothetical protein